MGSLPGVARRAALLTTALLLLAAPAASAQTFFVSKGGSGEACTEAAPCEKISEALTASRTAPGTGDEIRVGPGLYIERVRINDESDAGLTLRGSGRGPDETATPEGATTIRAAEDNKNNVIEIGKASKVSVEDLRVEVPAGFVNTSGIQIDAPEATLRGDHIQSAGTINTEPVWVDTAGTDARILNSRVRAPGEYRGIAIFAPRTTIADSDVSVSRQQAIDVEFPTTTGTRILRTRVESAEGRVITVQNAPDVVIDSSLIVGGEIGVSLYAGPGTTNLLSLSNDTIDADAPKSGQSGSGIEARSEGTGIATVNLVNSIALEKQRVEGEGASVTCKSSIVPSQSQTGAEGTVACGAGAGNAVPDPVALFVPGEDWHLRQGSPAVDSGEGEDALSTTDLDGAPRVIDGNGDGTAVIDRGAYELPTPLGGPGSGARNAPSNEFRFGKLRRNRAKGTATIQVRVPGPGRLVLFGKKVKRSVLILPSAGSFGLRIVPRNGLARTLMAKGSARIRFKVTFTPEGGTARTKAATRKLLRRRAH